MTDEQLAEELEHGARRGRLSNAFILRSAARRIRELSALRKPEREVVGWRVRSPYGAGFIYPLKPGTVGELTWNFSRAHRFATRDEAVTERADFWGSRARIVRVTRRKIDTEAK
jgi:hypothetical protein